MWTSLKTVRLIRYLLVWRVNTSFVRLPAPPSTAFSLVLGQIIASRLPTRQAAPWQKCLARWGADVRRAAPGDRKAQKVDLETLWPIESVLFAYPGKRNYGQGELILWELKLFEESADHGLFLEVILPAIEEAGYTSDPRWKGPDSLWGRFDIQAVYVARGSCWEPLVSGGRLNLHYRPSPAQWLDNLTFNPERTFNRLTWVSPVAFNGGPAGEASAPDAVQGATGGNIPDLQTMLEALLARCALLTGGGRRKAGGILEDLTPEEQMHLKEALEQAKGVASSAESLRPVPAHWPGQWQGTQIFDAIPAASIPYLQLASILHIGRQVHFGCGTLTLA